MANRWGKMEIVTGCVFLGSKITAVTIAMKLKGICSLENLDKPKQCIEKQRHLFADKDPYSESCGFSSSHVRM